LKVGLFGKAGSGKSTLLRALAGGQEPPASGKQAGVCTIQVPDERVDRLAAIFRPKKVTHVAITFEEIDPGETELLPAPTLAAVKGVDILTLVLRGFADDFHPAPPEGLSPVKEFQALESELVLADYLIAQKRVERMTKEAKRDAEWAALQKAVAILEGGQPMRRVPLSQEEARILSGFRFVSQLPLVLVVNVGEAEAAGQPYPEMDRAAADHGALLIRLSARIEEEIAGLPPNEQAEFLKEMRISRPAKAQLIRGAFEAMDYISFLTVGEDEVRAWNVRRGATAVAAAGRIHSDLERGFIRAEVIDCESFLRCGTMAKAKSEGKLRLEGKEYVVKDGDILHVRFNV
jgi:GTP-binding protein YchF